MLYVRKLLALFIFSEGYIGTGENVERVPVHDHVFHLDAVFLP